jgi:hypothetical protein
LLETNLIDIYSIAKLGKEKLGLFELRYRDRGRAEEKRNFLTTRCGTREQLTRVLFGLGANRDHIDEWFERVD